VQSLVAPPSATVTRTDDWHPFRVTTDTVESATGLDFLSEVDPKIQATLEAQVDTGD